MRKNKKLLLGGLSVLTLVAAGSGAVSTFAWFQVTNTAGTNYTAVDPVELTLDNTTHASTTTNFDITVTCTAVNWSGRNDVTSAGDHSETAATAKMELMTWKAAAGDNGQTAGINFGYKRSGAAAIYYQQTQFGTMDYWKVYEVSVSVAAQQGFTQSEIITALASKKYDVTIAKEDSNSIVFFYDVASGKQLAHDSSNRPEPRAAGSNSNKVFNNSGSGNAFTAAGEKYYFGVYLDGETHTLNSTTEDGNFTVTVADHV